LSPIVFIPKKEKKKIIFVIECCIGLVGKILPCRQIIFVYMAKIFYPWGKKIPCGKNIQKEIPSCSFDNVKTF
jgi:hypothetical protein